TCALPISVVFDTVGVVPGAVGVPALILIPSVVAVRRLDLTGAERALDCHARSGLDGDQGSVGLCFGVATNNDVRAPLYQGLPLCLICLLVHVVGVPAFVVGRVSLSRGAHGETDKLPPTLDGVDVHTGPADGCLMADRKSTRL